LWQHQMRYFAGVPKRGVFGSTLNAHWRTKTTGLPRKRPEATSSEHQLTALILWRTSIRALI
jgi:hypothetical protein